MFAVGDASELNRALDRYEDIDYTFSGSREGKLLRVCLIMQLTYFHGIMSMSSVSVGYICFDTFYIGTVVPRVQPMWAHAQQACIAYMHAWIFKGILHPVQDLADAQEQGDMEKFTDAVAEFDSMTRLDQWKTTLLLRAKKRIEGGPAAFGADEPDLT